ncbi:MAG: hypothetical protein FJ167_13030 [Gammaproteobacteria bacterium]|nr:hypothetical protein [Gammaproteobacteria bacterium]
MNPIMLSHCCLRPLKVESSGKGEGTNFYRCALCGWAADPITEAGVLNRLMDIRVDLGALYASHHQAEWAERVYEAEQCLGAATVWLLKRSATPSPTKHQEPRTTNSP